MKTGRHSRRFGAEYAYAAITPADVRCLPLLTSLAPAHPAYPPYWLLLPGLIHRTRPVIPLCADVSLFTPTFGAQWANTAKYSTTSAVIVIKKMCLAGAAECQAPPANKTCTYVTACRRTYHVTVDLISQNWNAVFGGHCGENNQINHKHGFIVVEKCVCVFSRSFDRWLLNKKLFLARKRLRSAADLSEFSAGAPWWRRSRTGWMGWWQSGRRSARQSDSPDVGGRSPKTSQAARANVHVSRRDTWRVILWRLSAHNFAWTRFQEFYKSS